MKPSPKRPAVLITGVTSGIGRELARQFAQKNFTVLGIARDVTKLAELHHLDSRIQTFAFDLEHTNKIEGFISRLVADHPEICGLVNNAAIQHNLRFDDKTYSTQQIAEEIAINLTAPAVLIHALLPHLHAMPHAFILNISSGLGFVPKKTSAIYSSTKAGLHLLNAALNVQLQSSTIRCTEIVLPLVDTPMTAGRGNNKLSASQAASAIVEAIHSRQAIQFVGKARLLPLLLRFAPKIIARFLQRGTS